MQLRYLAWVGPLVLVVPACSAIVNPDTTRLTDGPDTGRVEIDGGVPTPDTGVPPVDTGVPPTDAGTCTGSCDDTIVCTTDSCVAGTCRHVANDAVCTAGMRCAATMGCVAIACTSAADCNDGDMCNGTETCAPGTTGYAF